VTLDVLDAAGAVIRSFTSGAAGGAVQLENAVGMHRITWDLRHAGEGGRGAGPAVVPGRYTLRLSVPGAAPLTTPLDVQLDPRFAADGITVADLQAQYELALKVARLAADVQQLQAELRSARQRLEQAGNSAALQQLAALERRVVNQPGQAYPQQMLAAQVNYLNGIVTRGDNRPHRDAFERHDELRAELDSIRAALAALTR
jgi:hypothetical protein